MSQEKEKKLISLNTINLNDPSSQLNSPRSILACKKLGINPTDLLSISIDQYKDKNPSFNALPREILINRYQHYEKFRFESIQKAKKQRDDIIMMSKDSPSKSNNCSTISYNNKSRDPHLNTNQSTANVKSYEQLIDSQMTKEHRAIEKMKQRQKNEIQSMIEKEVIMDVIRHKSQEKEAKLLKKEESNKEDILMKNIAQEEKRKERELKRQSELNQRIEQQRKRSIEKETNEKKRMMEIIENDNKKKREFNEKSIIEKQKLKECLSIIEKNDEENKKRIEARRVVIESKLKERQHALDKERMEKIVTMERQKIEYERRLCLTKSNFDNHITQLQSSINDKQSNVEKKIEETNQQRDLSLKKKQEAESKRRQSILFALTKEEKAKKDKEKQYYSKIEQKDRTISNREMSRKLLMLQRSQSQNEMLIKTIGARTEKEKEEERKRKEILMRYDSKQKKLGEDLKIREQENINKIEEMFMKRFEKEQIIERLKRMQEYHNEKLIEELELRNRKIESFYNQKLQMKLNKVKMEDSIIKEKQTLIEQYESIKKKKGGIDVEAVKELYPNDEEFISRIKMLNEKKHSSTPSSVNVSKQLMLTKGNKIKEGDCDGNLSKIVGGSDSTEKTKDNNKEEEVKMKENKKRQIEMKVEEYKNQLIKEVNKVIGEEKAKEDQRVIRFNKVQKAKEIEKLEKELAKERADSDAKIKQLQSQLEEKVKKYEMKLLHEQFLS